MLTALILLLATACTSAGDSTQPTDTSIVDQPTTTLITLGEAPVLRWSMDEALVADPNCATPVAGEPLRIGYAAELDELSSDSDGPEAEAALYLVRLINCSGGVGGQPIDLQVVDISGTPRSTSQAVRELIDGGVSVIIGPPSADPGLRILEETMGRIPVVFATSTETALADPSELSFLAAFDNTQGATAAAQFALEQGWLTAVTFSAPGPYFGYNPEVFSQVFQAGGGTIVADYGYVPGETVDFSFEVSELAAAPPDVIYSAMFADQVSALRSELVGSAVGSEVIVSDAFEASGGYFTEGVDGVFHTTHAFPEPGSRVALLDESFQAETGGSVENPTFAALFSDALTVILDAYLRSGRGTPEAIGAAIAVGTDVEGVTGVLNYAGSGSPSKPVYIHQVVNGEPTLAAIIGP